MATSKHKGDGENMRYLNKTKTGVRVCINFENFPNHLSVHMRLHKHERCPLLHAFIKKKSQKKQGSLMVQLFF